LRPGLDSIVLGWTLGAAVGCLLYLGAMLGGRTPGAGHPSSPRRTGSTGRPVLSLYRSVLVYSVPILASSVITTSATYVDRLVLASVSDLSSLGFYTYALLIVAASAAAVGPFTTILLPRISEHLGRNDRPAIRAVTRTAITLIVLVYVPIALGIAALGPFLLRFLVGAPFVQDSLPMAVLLALAALAVPGIVLSALAAGVRRTPAVLRAAAFALAANAALSIALVPRVGILGAALGNSAMYWGPLTVLYFELRGSGLLAADLRAISRIWLASGAMALSVGIPLLLLGYPPMLAPPLVIVGIAVLLVGLKFLKAVPEEAAEFLLQVLPRRLGFLRPVVLWVAPRPEGGERETGVAPTG
ncbi:MAG: lipopolysaccharide biosynthesis protein, partial [Thermoplasmata archaeon]